MRTPMQAGDLSSRAALRRLNTPTPVPGATEQPTTGQPPSQPPPSGPPAPPPMEDAPPPVQPPPSQPQEQQEPPQQQTVSSFLQPQSYQSGPYGYIPGTQERFERATGMPYGSITGIKQYGNTMRKSYFGMGGNTW